jgi:hypothetical protein
VVFASDLMFYGFSGIQVLLAVISRTRRATIAFYDGGSFIGVA